VAVGQRGRARAEASLDELGLLARAAGATVVGKLIQERKRLDPATLIGRGKADDVARASVQGGADVVLFDDELSPAQQRNVEEILGRKTLDRAQLILDIFARRARTREGRLQVELAQLDYMLPRLSGKGVLLSWLGGGIGTRGRASRWKRTGGTSAEDPVGEARDRRGAAGASHPPGGAPQA
jgi:GTP-binding protein HflX